MTAADKTYDTTRTAVLSGGAIGSNATNANDGLVYATDTVSLVTSGASGLFATANAGTQAVTANGYSLSGANNNYSVTQPTIANATIAKAVLSVTPITGQFKEYGASDPNFTYLLTGYVGGDTSATGISGNLLRISGENVGSYQYSVSGLSSANYNFNLVINPSVFSINKADLTLNPTIGQSKNYGQPDSIFTYGVSGYVNNSLVYDTSSNVTISGAMTRAPGETIGTYAFNADSMTASNYNIRLVTSPASFTVLPAPIGIAISGSYSGTQTITPSNFSVTGLAFGQTISSISSAVVSDPNVASNSSNYVTSLIGVAGSALMSNYYITARYNGTPGTNTTNIATITPARLTIAAANDAKFVTQDDALASANNCGAGPCAGGYMGLTFNGFVNGQTKGVLSGSPSILRTNSDVNGAGVYTGVLKPSGYSSTNYDINYVNGDYVIAPANSLLVRVNPTSTTFGTAPTYTATAAYLTSDERTIVNLTPSISGSTVSISDGAGGSANFDLSMVGASLSTSRNTNVGGYNLTASNSSISGSNFNSLMVVGSATVKPFTLNPDQLGITTLSKVYDGNTNIGGLAINTDPTLSRVLGTGATKDQVTILGSGIFTDNPNVGTGKNVTVALSLSGVDGNNYVLSSNSYSAPIGTITQLDSVNYIGAPGGKWSTQTNWAGGAIPNLNNVGTAIIPVGYSVIYDASVIGSIGSIIQNNGTVSFNETAPFNLRNTLAGSGVFAQSGSGALTVFGDNSQVSPGVFTGQFSIAPGSTLLFANANALGAGSVVSNNGNFGLTAGTTLANLIISGPVNLISNIATTGSQVYGGPVTLAYGNQTADGAMRITSQDSDVTFESSLNSDNADRSLVLNALAGKVSLMGTTGYLSPSRFSKGADIYNLTINAKDILLEGDIYTLSAQVFNGAVVISDNGSNGIIRTFISQDPSITFLGTIDDSTAVTHTLNLKAVSFDANQIPQITFRGAIGSIVPLGGLIVTTEMRLDADPSPTVHGTPNGEITIGGNVTTIGDQTYTGGGVRFDPAPGAGPIILTSKTGTIGFIGPNGPGGDLDGHISPSGSFGGGTTVNGIPSYIPPLMPNEEQFLIAGKYADGEVLVSEPYKPVPCSASTPIDSDECR